jgi:hypothetical protein
MKGMLAAVAGIGLSGAAYFGTDSPDFDQVVRMSRGEVYTAFSALAPEGTTVLPATDALDRQVTIRVAKENGESIRYEILFDDRPVLTADLGFATAGDAQTRMTAELEIDGYQLGSAFQDEGGIGFAMMPESILDTQFATLMGEMVKQLESGRPLEPLGLGSARVRRHAEAGSSVSERRSEAERARRAAAAPMMRPHPMVRPEPMTDPNRAAENYRNGRDPSADGR